MCNLSHSVNITFVCLSNLNIVVRSIQGYEFNCYLKYNNLLGEIEMRAL